MGPLAETILVIEDNPIALTAVSLFLREYGYHVVQARDGDRALKLLREGLKPDLVLSDISLPGSDGYRILKYVRSSTLPHTPVILMSANFTLGCPALAAGGADAYVFKPLNLEDLVQKVSAAIDSRRHAKYDAAPAAKLRTARRKRRFT